MPRDYVEKMKSHVKFAFMLPLLARFAAAACNASTPEPVVTISLPGHPFGVVPSNDGCWLFVSLPVGGISVLRRDNGHVEITRTQKIEARATTGMVLTHDGKTLIVAGGFRVLFLDVARLISGEGNPTVATISDGEKASSVYVNVTSDDKTLFVSDEGAQTITVIDLEHNRKTIGTIPVGLAPIALTFSKDEKYLYTTSQSAPSDWKWPKACKPEGQDAAKAEIKNPEGAVIVVDVARAKTDPAHSIVSRVPAACSPVRIAMAPLGDRIYVTARNSNALLSFDTAKLVSDPDHARLGMAQVGTAPVPVAVVDDGRLVIVGNSNRFDTDQSKAQMLDVLRAGALTLSEHIPAGSFPREMRLSPDGSTLFLTNFSSDSLQIIDLKRSVTYRRP
jgi:YVTN family beta-propeller protein